MDLYYDDLDDDEIIPDGGGLHVNSMMMDSLDPVQRAVLFGDQQQQPVLDAYQQFEAGRAAWRKQRDAELQAVIDGTSTPDHAAALVKRQEAWERRGEQQANAWQKKPPAIADNAPPQPNASLADAEAAREAAWRKRGELQQNAWRR